MEPAGDAGTHLPDATSPLDDAGAIVDAHPEAASELEASADAGLDGRADATSIADASLDGAVVDAEADAGPPAETVIDVVTSRMRTCFLMSTGRLFCAGSGIGTTPTLVPGVTDAVEVTIGGTNFGDEPHTCVRRKGGTVECWGGNGHGQLGDGTTVRRASPTPVVGLTDVVQIVAADYDNYTCARKSNGAVLCWGVNYYGELGNGTVSRSTLPSPVSGLTNAIDITAGFGGGCAIRNGGQVVCWGFGEYGRLGDGDLPHEQCIYVSLPSKCSLVPVPANLSDAVAISRGGRGVYAIRADGSVWSWGQGALGTGSSAGSSNPVPTLGPVVATRISAAAGGGCARRPSGVVTCWGTDESGQLGNGLPASESTEPVDVLGIADATRVSSRWQSACALRAGGVVSCWGRNEFGNLANGATSNLTPSPVDVVW